MRNSEDSTEFITIELKTEDEETYRVPILRCTDEVRINFYPRGPEEGRTRFCLETKKFRESGPEASMCFGSRCVRCGRHTCGTIRPTLAPNAQGNGPGLQADLLN